MTSERRAGGRIGGVFTGLLVAVCVVLLTGLGVWQVKRLHWKEDYLRRVAAAQAAPARPIGEALAEAARGGDVEYQRVSIDCLPPPAAPARPLYVWDVQGDSHGWRPIAACQLGSGLVVAVDRGFVPAPGGRLEVPTTTLSPVVHAIGQLRKAGAQGWFDQAGTAASGFHSRRAAVAELARQTPGRYAPFAVAVEREDPAPQGVTPAPLPTNIPNNHLGYAITWFGLALSLIGVYVAALFKRRRP